MNELCTSSQQKPVEKILLVDDDQVFTRVMQRALSRLGFEIHTAQTAQEALALAQETLFDRAILDLKLEFSSGLQLIAELRAVQAGLRIVVLTGYSSVSTAVEAIKLGAVNYLCKPAPVSEILAAFENTQGNSSASLMEVRPSVDRVEWEHIQRVLLENQNNISATARALGMHRRTLQRKLQKRPAKQ